MIEFIRTEWKSINTIINSKNTPLIHFVHNIHFNERMKYIIDKYDSEIL